MESKVGDVIRGFSTPDLVQTVHSPGELSYLVDIEEWRREEKRGCFVHIGNWANPAFPINFTRLPNENSLTDKPQVAVFEFDVLEGKYILRYNPGSDESPGEVFIEPKKKLSRVYKIYKYSS